MQVWCLWQRKDFSTCPAQSHTHADGRTDHRAGLTPHFDCTLHHSVQKQKKIQKILLFPNLCHYTGRPFFSPLNGSNPPQQPQTSRCPGSPPQNLLDVPQQGQLYLMGKCCCLLLSLTIPGWHPPHPLQNWSQQAPCMLGIHTSNSATHFSYSSRAVGCELTGPLHTDLDPVIPACAGSGGSNKGFSGSV